MPEQLSIHPSTMLVTDYLSKHFGGVHAVRDISIHVTEGKITSIIGPNGAGKTTLFNMITSIFPPTSGKVLFRETDDWIEISGKRGDQIAELGIARTFQNIRLFGELSVLDNVRIGFHPCNKVTFFDAIFKTKLFRYEEELITHSGLKYLDFVGIAEFATERAKNLSYGDQRLVEIARALAIQPSLLLLDEPAAGMNPSETQSLMKLIYRIRNNGITVLLIEHDMRLVMGISDHVIVLDHGDKIAEGPPQTVQSNPQVIEAYLGVHHN